MTKNIKPWYASAGVFLCPPYKAYISLLEINNLIQ